MRHPLLCIISLFLLTPSVLANAGLISIKSAHDVTATTDRLERALLNKGMKVFTRINHSTGAAATGLALRPTELLIFGNPQVGTPLMICRQTTAIDLPQKALIWEDENGQTWLSYNAPDYLQRRHHIEGCEAIIRKISKALHNFAQAATQH